MRLLGRTGRARLMLGAAVGVIASGLGVAHAEDRAAINVAPQPLESALYDFGGQTGLQVLFAPGLATSKRTAGVADETDAQAALSRILEGTGLSFRRNGDMFVIVQGGSGDPQSAGAGGDVDALIVTAQKREENIQDVPIAISAFSQEDLTTRQVAGGPDLMTQVPNMTFTKTNFSSYSIQLRGIGTQAISATVDPAVAVAFNNTPFVRNRFFEQEFYDLQRVEVLRGPQGTLYGRNATAGVVNIISAKPSFKYEAKLSGDVSNYKSSRLEGMVNLPLVEDKVAMRLAAAWTKRDGYVTNEITGNPIDGRDLWSTRLSLRFSPNDRFDANLIWEHFQEDDDRLRSGKQLCKKHITTEVGGVEIPDAIDGAFPGITGVPYQQQLSQGCAPSSLYSPDSFETPNGFQFGFYWPLGQIGLPVNRAAGQADPYVSNFQSRDLRVIESTVDPSYKAKSDVVQLQATVDLTDTLSLSSETAWASDFVYSIQDYNRFNTKPGAWAQMDNRPGVLEDGVFCDPQLGCSDRLVLVDLSTAKSRHFSQELRLASDFDGPFNFSLGANFLRYDTEDKYYVFINALTLWSAAEFASNIPTPYEMGETTNAECLDKGLEIIDPGASGGVSTIGQCMFIDPNPIGSITDLGHHYFLSKNPYKLISYAMFGEAYYDITDSLKVTAGLRWTVDKKEAPRIPNWILAEGVGYPVLEVVEQEWREPTGRLTIDWKPDLSFTDETLLYASYAHGYKAGGANPPPAGIALNVNTGPGVPPPSDTHPTTFEAEYVDAFELGAKNTFLDGRMTLNLAAFYYDYKGYQLSQIVDRSAITKNFDATVWGLEIEADWRPLENLRLGFKGGYEDTEVADGMSAVDVMDRANGGRPDENGISWIVVKPFPTFPSNCILPEFLFLRDGGVRQVGTPGGSDNGPCNVTYFEGLDIFTMEPYEPFPEGPGPHFYSNGGFGASYTNYPGFNPASAPNNGEGFSKDLSGNELPNAPHFTATITADWTLPLPNEWLMTLHSDLYWQSEAWTRIFNMEGYDKLKAYTNINLAAIFSNDEAGWRVMAYVKNVMNRDSITGAFLNSDDSGLTTNVFLTEPRLYGIRITKDWNGGPWWTGAGSSHTPGEPYPFTIELGGQVQRQDAPYDPILPAFTDEFSPALSSVTAQNHDLDWGDGRDLKVTWRPGGVWSIAAGLRYGRINGGPGHWRQEEDGDGGCGRTYPTCVDYLTALNWSDTTVTNREDHQIADFEVGLDVGLGALGLERSAVGLGLRYAQFNSETSFAMEGIPDWYIPDNWYDLKYPIDTSSHRYNASLEAVRTFDGAGPMLSWDAAKRLFGDEEVGHVDLDWSLAGGVLFGKQKMSITGEEGSGYWAGFYDFGAPRVLTDVQSAPVSIHRSDSVTVPVVDVSLGLSYEIQRIKLGAGYRWERYFDVLDAGFDEHKSYDRTIDGPYFKVSVGFGG